MESNVVFDLIGWAGVSTVLLAYGLVSFGRVEGGSIPYQLMNVTGAGFLLLNSIYHGAMPPAGANAAWVGIGLFALARRVRYRKTPA